MLVYAARGRGEGEAPLLYACLLLSNAGSLLLPGSNLTNLIVLGHLHLSGRAFFAHMALAGLVAAPSPPLVVGVVHRRTLRTTITARAEPERPVLGVGLFAVAAVTVLVLVLRAPALPVAAVGVARRGPQVGAAGTPPTRRGRPSRVLGLPVLVGLFGLAVALGTLGRAWSGPATLLVAPRRLGDGRSGGPRQRAREQPAGGVAPGGPPTPAPLLACWSGLNVGPNLFVTGRWPGSCGCGPRGAPAGQPDIRRASLLGLAGAPLAIAAAVAVLVLGGAT